MIPERAAPRILRRDRRRAASLAAALTALVEGGVTGSGCNSRDAVPVEIRFAAQVEGLPFSCSAAPAAGSVSPRGPVPRDLRFFVHDVKLIDREGRAAPVALVPDGTWQTDSVALLDFEDGAAACTNGTAGTHRSLAGRVAPGDYVGLRFTVGVPLAANHADPARAVAPLTLGRMHWGWQGGYKFLRFEAGDAEGRAFRVHLGSTGCEGTIGHVSGCRRPNRAVVELEGFVPARSTVRIDLAALLDRPPGLRRDDGSPGCMSEPGDPACREPFAALGLDPATGARTGAQRLFAIQPS